MRNRIIAAVTLAALLITGGIAAFAAPGTASDPFVTLSYLTEEFYPEMEALALKQAQEATSKVEKKAFDRLEALSGSYLAQTGGKSQTDAFLRMTLYRNDRLDIPSGSSLLYEGGVVEVVLASGALIDVTDGTIVYDGGTLTAGHRYVAAENTACSITAVSDAAYLSVRGHYNLAATGETRTPFTDIQEADWFYSYVRYAYEESLFSGMTPTTFSPNTNMSRAMLVTVLCRIAGMEGREVPSAGFSDVPDSAWYANSVNWAAAANIVQATPGTKFNPNADATREELADMLFRFAKFFMGADMAEGDLSAYTDASKISPFARDAVSWAVSQGVINGATPTTLSPTGSATRAQVATMLQRFINLF